LDPTQVRKDLAATGIVGKPRVGYQIKELIATVESFLGWSNNSDAFLVGAGHLGAALMKYAGFNAWGLNIIAAFDVDETKVGTQLNGRKVFHLDKMPDLARRMRIKIGINTAPASAAQDVVDRMMAGGIQAIWNFAPAKLTVPDGVIVENVSLSSSWAVLSAKFNEKMRHESLALSQE
jgi:redox-sensing transcriptional repressor